MRFCHSVSPRTVTASSGRSYARCRPEGLRTRLILTEQCALLDGADQPEFREQGWRELMDAQDAELRRELTTA